MSYLIILSHSLKPVEYLFLESSIRSPVDEGYVPLQELITHEL